MKEGGLRKKVTNATKWSTITEVATKLISPITNMILARIVAPEAFGVIATVTMIMSFAEMFTDSGFQKYLVQHDFKDEEEKIRSFNVAFWCNFSLSVLFWFAIVLLRENIATLVGNPGLGHVIAIASFQLPLTAFSSIQMAYYRREFDFKTLFLSRMISVFIPFFVTIPLAYFGLSYWALIVGTLLMQITNAVLLTIKSVWKPKLYFNIKLLKSMFSFSMWSLIEAIAIWLSIWIDTFIIGNFLNQYYLGLYKTSTSMVNAIISVVTSSIIPILFATLSRLQEDKSLFSRIFLQFQRLISILILPMGIGIYLFSDMATQLLLGNKWLEASGIIGIWGLTRSIKIVFGDLSSEVYRAKGMPKLSFIAQLLHLIVLIPTCIIAVQYGFEIFVYARSWIQMQFVFIHLIVMHFIIKIPVSSIIKNVLPTTTSSLIMGLIGYILIGMNNNIAWQIFAVFICILVYFIVLFLFSDIRNEILNIVKNTLPKKYFKKIRT